MCLLEKIVLPSANTPSWIQYPTENVLFQGYMWSFLPASSQKEVNHR